VLGLCTRINTGFRKHPLCLGTPPPPFIAHTNAQYSGLPTILYCITCHTLLVMAISCKSQRPSPQLPESRVAGCQVQERAANRLYYLSAKIVQSVSGSLLYLTKQESSWGTAGCWWVSGPTHTARRPSWRPLARGNLCPWAGFDHANLDGHLHLDLAVRLVTDQLQVGEGALLEAGHLVRNHELRDNMKPVFSLRSVSVYADKWWVACIRN